MSDRTPLRLGIAGFGKIARDQHAPAIAGSPALVLAAVADPAGGPDGVPCYPSLDAMLAAEPALDAIALCTPPQGRAALAEACLRAGKHVLLEKPPGVTVGELASLLALADAAGLTLFAAWHSRFAPAVEPARALLAGATIDRVHITWREDVRRWHPGQRWIWQPGGFGVFDPGINALSVLTRILPRPPILAAATLSIPQGRQTPIAASLALRDPAGAPITAEFDWRHTGEQVWDIDVTTPDFELALQAGGRRLRRDGAVLLDEPKREYPALYRRFVALIAERRSDVDLSPLALVADAALLGERQEVEPFADG